MSTGAKIHDLRKQNRISQVELAKMVHVSQATVTAWETGKADPSSSALNSLADFFGVSSDYLLGREKNKDKKPIDIKNDPVVLSYGGKPVSKEDMDVIKAILARHQGWKEVVLWKMS